MKDRLIWLYYDISISLWSRLMTFKWNMFVDLVIYIGIFILGFVFGMAVGITISDLIHFDPATIEDTECIRLNDVGI